MFRDPDDRTTSAPPSWMDFPAIDTRPSLLILSGDADAPDLRAVADGAGFRVVSALSLAEMPQALETMVGADALLVDLRSLATGRQLEHVTGAVRAWPAFADAALLTCVTPDQIETVLSGLAPDPDTMLCAPGLADIAAELCLLARRSVAARLHDIGREGEGNRLEQLSEEVRRLARTIERLTLGENDVPHALREEERHYAAPPSDSQPQGDRGAVPAVSRREVQALLQARRARDRYMPADLFADPAWDMMLDLMAARLEGTRVSVSSLCIAAAVPPTTALRWITQLTKRGICERRNDPEDARRVFITLTDEAFENLAAWFAAVRRNGLRFA